MTSSILLAAPSLATASTTLHVTTTTDVPVTTGPCGSSSITATPSPLSLREATCLANNLGGAVTIDIPAGTYLLDYGELQPGLHSGQTVDLVGAGQGSTIIDAQHLSRVIEFDLNVVGNITDTLSNLTIRNGRESNYGGGGVVAGSDSTADALTVDSVRFDHNESGVGSTSNSRVGGALAFNAGVLTIKDSTFDHNTAHDSPGGAVGYASQQLVSPRGMTITNTTFDANETQSDAGNPVAYPNGGGAVAMVGMYAAASIAGSRFVGNRATGTNGSAAGGAIWSTQAPVTVTGSTFTGNTATAAAGWIAQGGAIANGHTTYSATPAMTLHGNRFAGNTSGNGAAVDRLNGSVDATDDWWGCNGGPAGLGCDTVGAGVSATSWLRLTADAASASLTGPNATTTISARLTTNSDNNTVPASELAGLGGDVTWSDPQPSPATINGSTSASTTALASGTATAIYDSKSSSGSGHVVAQLDNATATVPLTVALATPPAVTSDPADRTAAPGSSVTFTAAASGSPAPSVQWQRDTGSGFVNVAGATSASYTFSAALGDSGNRYRAVFTNASGSATSAAATLLVGSRPAFTSAAGTTFTVGQAGAFTVQTSGQPSPAITVHSTLPPWLTVTDDGDGTAELAGTPPAGAADTYAIALDAVNPLGGDSQAFTLQIQEAPTVTADPADAAVAPGATATFTAAASGRPVPAVRWQRDDGSGFADIPGATSTTYAFSTTLSDSGARYRAVFANAAGTTPTAAATLTVGTAPAITSVDHVTFTGGHAGTLTVTTTGAPAPAITTADPLPSWLQLHDNGDGTATLEGTPGDGDGGTLTLTLKAANGIAPAATQAFELTVDEEPVVTQGPDDTTVAPGATATFTAVASGSPAPTAQWQVDTGGGFADIPGATSDTYAFTAALGDSGNRYRAVLSNRAGSVTTVDAALTVGVAPAFHGSSSAQAVAGVPARVPLDVDGTPQPTLALGAGAPAWLSLDTGGAGPALVGTPPVGSGGVHHVTVRAANGIAPAADQDITLTVVESPVITSADRATMDAGSAGRFVVTTRAGFPAATQLALVAGDLPRGLTFTDLGDGTAELGGTPASRTGGRYPLSLRASNAAGQQSTQALALTVLEAPAPVGADQVTLAPGGQPSTPVVFSGYPAPRLRVAGALPPGMTFTDNGDGTGTLLGAPSAAGTYAVTVEADNGLAIRSRTLTITVRAGGTPAPGGDAVALATAPAVAPAATPAAPPPACRSDRVVKIHLLPPAGVRLRRTTVTVGGRPYLTLAGDRRSLVVRLVGYPAGRVQVRLRAVTTKNMVLTGRRVYRLCGYREAAATPLEPLHRPARSRRR